MRLFLPYLLLFASFYKEIYTLSGKVCVTTRLELQYSVMCNITWETNWYGCSESVTTSSCQKTLPMCNQECRTSLYSCNINCFCHVYCCKAQYVLVYDQECCPGYEEKEGVCTGICNHECLNGGNCIGFNICKCQPGFLGNYCEKGGDESRLITPVLNASQLRPGYFNSWYPVSKESEFGRVCKMKVSVRNAPMELIISAASFQKEGTTYGEFSVGPVDKDYSLNRTTRTACVEFRCPFYNDNNVMVQLKVQTLREIQCKCIYINERLDREANQPERNNSLTFSFLSGENYGSLFGVYIVGGSYDVSDYLSQQLCFQGTNGVPNNIIDPEKNVAVLFDCE